jgi:N-methylhydantoinase B/oxoprolinase/acetone carboxylase alpha subunit
VIYCGIFRGEFGPGDVISYLADGGGGCGDPFTRDAERVRNDVIDGYEPCSCRTRVRVVLTDKQKIDQSATQRLRSMPRVQPAEAPVRKPPPKQRSSN